jgi:hypothetical protein
MLLDVLLAPIAELADLASTPASLDTAQYELVLGSNSQLGSTAS